MSILVINADDFGISEAVNHAVIGAYDAGCLTSATLMVNMPAAEEAAALSRTRPGLGIGLHFNLTSGVPLSDAALESVLVANGHFRSRGNLLRLAVTGRVPLSAVRSELAAQCERANQLGIHVTHIDSHQHVHALPGVFDVIAEHCEGRDIPIRVPWIAKVPGSRFNMKRLVSQLVLRAMLSRDTRRWRGKVRWNDALVSLFDLGAFPPIPADEHYRAVLAGHRSGAVVELMVHPTRDAGAMEGLTSIGAFGEAEWRYLRSGSLASVAEDCGFALRNYGSAWA